MPLSDAERQARRRGKQAQELSGLKVTIAQLLQEIDRLRQGSPSADRESRALRDKVAKLEADNARLVAELRAERAKARPKMRRKAPPRMDRSTFAKIVRALHPTGAEGEPLPSWTTPARRSTSGGTPSDPLPKARAWGKQRTKFETLGAVWAPISPLVLVLVWASL
jgi:hypothetical protein